MQRVFLRAAVSLLFLMLPVSSALASANKTFPSCSSSLTQSIPGRTIDAIGGSAFVAAASKIGPDERESLIFDQFAEGNVPEFLRQLTPVSFEGRTETGRITVVTLCVTPDYLAVGSDHDFVRVPMGLGTAMQIAKHFDFALPTTKVVDAIYRQAEGRLAPKPMTPGPQMVSTEYFSRHNRIVEQQRTAKGISLGQLLAGHKKDLVLTNRLRSKPGRVAIYGWHRSNGKPIQPLSTVHGAQYADYSHGVRLVSTAAFVDGERRSLYDVLEDPRLAAMISKEGRIPQATEIAAASPVGDDLSIASAGRGDRGG